MLGRRGPAQAAYTNPEVKELGELEEADVVVDPAEIELDPASKAWIESEEADKTARVNVEIVQEYATRKPSGKPKKVVLRFLSSPVEIKGGSKVESIVIGQDWQHDVRVVLFVRLRDGVKLDDALKDKIKAQIRNNTTPRHVPAKIVAVADIPRTKSGKITELAVRDTVHGKAVKNKEALANPEALDLYVDVKELQS